MMNVWHLGGGFLVMHLATKMVKQRGIVMLLKGRLRNLLTDAETLIVCITGTDIC